MNTASRQKLDPILENYFRSNPETNRVDLMKRIAKRANVYYSTVYRWFEKIEANEDLKKSKAVHIANELGVNWKELID